MKGAAIAYNESMNPQNTKITEFLEEFRRQVLWEEKKPPNTILRSAYLNGVSKIAMAGLASRLPDTKLHIVSCKTEEGKQLVNEWFITHAGQAISIEGPTTSEMAGDFVLQRAHH